MTQKKRVVLAFSGGLDTSVILKWLQTDLKYAMRFEIEDNFLTVEFRFILPLQSMARTTANV